MTVEEKKLLRDNAMRKHQVLYKEEEDKQSLRKPVSSNQWHVGVLVPKIKRKPA